MNKRPVVIIGGGGHARVVIDALLASQEDVIGFVDRDPEKKGLEGVGRLGSEDYIVSQYRPEEIFLVNGIGSVQAPEVRKHVFQSFKDQGYFFAQVIHPRAIVAASAVLREGVQLMAGSIVQPGTVVGMNSIINTHSSVDHDCRLGAHVHIAPGATLSGNVSVGDDSHIGTGASIIQGIHIGRGSVVGAGSVVIRDVEEATTVAGVPAVKR